MFATHLKQQKKTRVLSLGTGLPNPSTYDLDDWNLLDYHILSIELMIDIDVEMSGQQLSRALKRQAKEIKEEQGVDINNYLRVQCYTDLPMDKTDQDTINGLLATGRELFNNNTQAITSMIQQIVDEKFGYFENN